MTNETTAGCRWVSSTEPRVVPGRHGYGCNDEACPGCQPCERAHCRVCAKTHAAGTCVGCLAEARDDLSEILRMCAALPKEVEHRGIDGEAMNLLGPVADPERLAYTQASYLAGRLPEGWIETSRHSKDCPLLTNEPCTGCGGDEMHPLAVLGTWAMVYAAEFEHDQAERITVSSAGDYLGRHLTQAAEWPHAEFADLACDLRKSRAHVERVLHDGEQVEQGAPCHLCPEGNQPRLEKRYAKDRTGSRDSWHCPRETNHWWTEAEYRLRVSGDYVRHASALNVTQLQARLHVSRGSVTGWASNGKVRKRGKDASGRQLYDVADVMRMQDETRDRRTA